MLKCISELLVRCASQVSMTVNANGLGFLACDPLRGRLIHIVIKNADMGGFSFKRHAPLRCILESNSLHAVFHTDH